MQARSGPTEVVSGLVDGCGKTAAAIEYRMSSADLVSTLTARTPSIDGSHTDRRVLAPRYVEEMVYQVLRREQFARMLQIARQSTGTPISNTCCGARGRTGRA